MAYAQPGISPREWDAQSSLGVWCRNGSPNLRHSDSKKKKEKRKKRSYWIVDFAIPTDHIVK